MTWHVGSSIDLFDGGIAPDGIRSGPVCVPFHTTSMIAVSPLANSRTNVAFESGKAVAQPLHTSIIGSAPCRRLCVVGAACTEQIRHPAPVLVVVCNRRSLRDF